MKVDIYTDGSSRGNPGPGGYGTVIIYMAPSGKIYRREYSEGFRLTTNSRMELLAAVVGLEKLTKPCQVDIYSDSQYLVDAFQKGWIDSWIKRDWRNSTKNPVKNQDLWKRLLKASGPHRVDYHWIKGHAGHPENERCDQLAVAAAQSNILKEDRNYLQKL